MLPLLPERSSAVADEPVEPPGRSTRTAAVVVIAVIGVLVLLSALSGGGGADEAGDTAPTSTTNRRPTTTTRPATTSPGTTVAEPALAEGQVLDPAYGTALLVATGDTMTIVDLSTGAEVVVENPVQLETLTWTGEVLLARAPANGILRAGPGTEGWQAVELGQGHGWIGTGGVIQVHAADGSVQSFAHVGPDGAVRTWVLDPAAVAAYMSGPGALAVIGDDLVIGTFDGVFALSPSGAGRRIANGRPVAAGGGHLLVQSCDDRMRCRPSLIELASGTQRVLPPLDGLDIGVGSVSPDGQRVMVGGYGPAGEGAFLLVGDEWVEGGPGLLWNGVNVTWAPDSSGVVWWDWNLGQVHSMPADGSSDRSSMVQLTNDVRRRLREGPSSPVAVVPLAALPEAWRPAPATDGGAA